MNGNTQIEENREALKRILATLVAMAGMGAGGQFTFFRQGGAATSRLARAEKSKLSPALTLPRHLYRAILWLLRPAESAARRLIIAASRGIVVQLPPFRPRKPKEPEIRRGPRAFMPVMPKKRPKPAPRAVNLPLLDPLKNPFRIRRRYVPAHAAPRIRSFGFDSPFLPRPPPPSSDDPIVVARLGQHLAALAAALDDLPGQAKRFARWKARNDAAWARVKEGREPWRPRRVLPLRAGPPPGGRLWRYDPDARRRSNIREIDEILAHAHALAVYALERPRRDTS